MDKTDLHLSIQERMKVQEALDDMNRDECCFFVNGRLDEYKFCDFYIQLRNIENINGELHDLNGKLSDRKIASEIVTLLDGKVRNNVAAVVRALLNMIKLRAESEEFHPEEDRIHFANGTYFLNSKVFTNEKFFGLYRLPVKYNSSPAMPETFFNYLYDLMEPDDVPTLQEFMGYCLIPTTKAQAMLVIVGRGGEGKSQLGVVLRSIFGDCMNTGSIKKLTTNRFAKADLENKLLMLDDDMSMDSVSDTDVLKSLITSDGKSECERKGEQSRQAVFFSRIMAFSNSPISSLYDKSEGFYRRQLIIRVKEKSRNRVDDKFLGDKLKEEAEGILYWMIEGLHRLIDNRYNFTVSDRSKALLRQSKESDNNIISFLNDSQFVRFGADLRETSRNLYRSYCSWCEENLEKPFSARSFSLYLVNNQEAYGIKYSYHIPSGAGSHARGFTGIAAANIF